VIGGAYFLKARSPRKTDARMAKMLAAATNARIIGSLRERRYLSPPARC
jgi:hypothetical protein